MSEVLRSVVHERRNHLTPTSIQKYYRSNQNRSSGNPRVHEQGRTEDTIQMSRSVGAYGSTLETRQGSYKQSVSRGLRREKTRINTYRNLVSEHQTRLDGPAALGQIPALVILLITLFFSTFSST